MWLPNCPYENPQLHARNQHGHLNSENNQCQNSICPMVNWIFRHAFGLWNHHFSQVLLCIYINFNPTLWYRIGHFGNSLSYDFGFQYWNYHNFNFGLICCRRTVPKTINSNQPGPFIIQHLWNPAFLPYSIHALASG